MTEAPSKPDKFWVRVRHKCGHSFRVHFNPHVSDEYRQQYLARIKSVNCVDWTAGPYYCARAGAYRAD